MRQDRDSIGSSDRFQHLAGGQAFAEKGYPAPHQDMNSVGRIAVLDAGYDSNVAGTGLSAGVSIPIEARGSKSAVVLGHHHNPAAAATKLAA
jgi:hypothetical protein